VSEWLDLMLEEIARKKREAKEADQEVQRRKESAKPVSTKDRPQSK